MKRIFNTRFSLLFTFIVTYLILSFLVRSALYIWSIPNIEFSILGLLKIYGLGLYFDAGVSLFFVLLYSIYLLLTPKKFIGSLADKILTYFIIGLMLFIALFGLIGEFPFWEEFNNRYNFIAVDYLIYTYEVVENINQSYPIPLILIFQFSVIFSIFFIYKKKGVLHKTFTQKTSFIKRLLIVIPIIFLSFLHINFAKNKQAEWSENTYNNELSKNGVFSLFAAYISNELDYNSFYKTMPNKKAYTILKEQLKQNNQTYLSTKQDDISRVVKSNSLEQTPNIIMVTIESLSADFMTTFGNKNNLTPNIEKLAKESLFFTNMYATGTRTVRGMEALTLCVPPTPGHSIVRRPNNENLLSIASILKQKKYALNFIYGGDGYFDNMNYFFGSQGFDIIDRDRGNPLSDNIKTTRYPINEEEITFENAWGICDADIYEQALKRADFQSKENRPFFQFIMTTSNHRPYSFPEGKINLPQGSRKSAVKYTDYALGEFIKKAKTKKWFKNTIFVIVSDHCASSAGKWEININNHHIPAMIYNLKNQQGKVNKLVSQIDLMPTVFGLLNWTYTTELYGKDINKMKPNEERALLGNYRTLGLLKNGVFTQLTDRKQVQQYKWNSNKKEMTELNSQIDTLQNIAISYYQTASERFKNGKMKETKTNK
ncbi:MAG: sulfatase-like hydrolase/transferase [Tenacibaculum sp.]|nr:sulfatase-like hydrolase/transferase [Tenacibaculum sp.]